MGEARDVSRDRIYVVEDWEGLEASTSPRSGDHTLKLVVDSTGLIPETDESDNEIELELTWSADLKATSTEPVPTKLPDFAVRIRLLECTADSDLVRWRH